MQALVTRPGEAHSTHVEDVSEPTGEGLLVRVLEVGVCGTDREISEGHFGAPPEGRDLLVLGHEMLGVVEQDGNGFAAGDHVTAIVRRSCGHCVACAENAPDSCLTGDYVERGITRLDGFARERLREDPRQLIGIPASLGRLGVLAEPTSVCARALRHSHEIGGRQPWQLETALVIGGGAVGTLMTLLLRLEGIAVTVASLEQTNDRITALGARYACSDGLDLKELGQFDLVVEAAGDAQLMADTLGLLRRNGIACLLGIDGREQRVSVDGPTLGVDMLLGNRVLFGSVNAQRRDWLAAVDALDRAQDKWRDVLESFISLRVPLDRFGEAFAHRGGKATLVLEQ